MRKYIVMAIVLVMGLSIVHAGAKQALSSDEFVRRMVVKLDSKLGACTGEAVIAKSGRVYTLTAAHCRAILINGEAKATREDGSTYVVKIIMYDATTDLMLMTSPEHIGLHLAKGVIRHEPMHAITHGGGHDAFRSDGELMEEIEAHVSVMYINSDEDMRICKKEKNNSIESTIFGNICIAKLQEMASTVRVIPGSSGGAILNSNAEVVGVVSAGQPDGLSLIVPFRFVKALLERY